MGRGLVSPSGEVGVSVSGREEGRVARVNKRPPPFTLVQKNVLTVREVLKRIVFDMRDTKKKKAAYDYCRIN